MPKRAATKKVTDALKEEYANQNAETKVTPKRGGGKRKRVEPAAGLEAIERKKPGSSDPDFSYDPYFVAKDEQMRLIKELDKVPWVKVTYEKFKKQRSTPRHTFTYGTPDPEGKPVEVSYRGPHYMTEAMPEWLDTLKKKVEERTGFEYNAAIMNNYINEGEYISWHTDDERFLKHTTVASLSFGAGRTFHVRTSPFGAICKMKKGKPAAAKPAKKKAKLEPKDDEDEQEEEEAPVEFNKDLVEETAVKLISGSLSVLYNGIEHSVPKETPEKFGDMTNRYNITFRCLKDFDPSQKQSGWGNYYNYNRGAAYQINKKD